MRTRAYIYTYTHTYTHVHIHSQTNILTHPHTFIHKHMHTYTYMHTRTHVLMYTHTHTHTLIVFRKNGAGRLHTSIFDKRDRLPLSRLHFIVYPHIDSFISLKCKYGVLTCQLFPYLRICSRKRDFVWFARKIIHALLNKGYNKNILSRFFFRFVWHHRYMYGLNGYNSRRVSIFVDFYFLLHNLQ